MAALRCPFPTVIAEVFIYVCTSICLLRAGWKDPQFVLMDVCKSKCERGIVMFSCQQRQLWILNNHMTLIESTGAVAKDVFRGR